jgi:amino acid adenylation domain-containing protein
MLAWQNNDEGELRLPGLEVSEVEVVHTTAKFDLDLDLAEFDGGIVGHLEFATALFDRATMQRYVGYLRRTLLAMADDDTQPLDRIELLDAAEHAQLAAWNAIDTDSPTGLCVHHLFEAQVKRTPDAVALRFEDKTLTYAQLDTKADRLARYLLNAGVTPGARVGIYLSRSPELLIAVLGTLKAGAAYVPLEPKLPKERLGYMVQDAGIDWAVLESLTVDELPVQNVILMDGAASDEHWLEDYAQGDLPGVAMSDVAYVIYTSGSTGRPKGVMVEHGGLSNYLAHAVESYLPGVAGSVVSSPLSFDATLTTLLPPLLAGKPVWLLPDETHAQTLVRLSERLFAAGEGWLFKITPAHLDALSYLQREVALGQARHCIVVGGEQLPAATLRRWKGELLPQASFVNEYGPTETVVGCSVWTLSQEAQLAQLDRSTATPIGRPIGNTQLYVLGAHQQLQPMGSVGELYIGGAGVARGYLNQQGLTQERFIDNPFAAGRLYRTGDLVRYLGEGDLEFVGRIDEQVKIRGFRIELGEIEAQLLRQPGVRETAVLAREDTPGDKHLVAYVVASDGASADAHSLREALAQTLPDYMVPAAYVRLAELPLTTNGKLDRKSLPVPQLDAYASQAYEAPQGATEIALARIWEQVLGREGIGRHDDFFGLGGHSLLAIRMLSHAHQHGIALVLADVFRQPSLAALAAIARESIAPIARVAVVPIRAADAGEDEAAPLFLCHDGYGEDLYMYTLTRHLPAGLPVYGLPAQDLPEPQQVPAIAAAMLAAIRDTQAQGPYRIGGWSFGGVLAYEIACQLRAQGERIAFLGLIDSYHPSVYDYDSDTEHMSVAVLDQPGRTLQAAMEAVPTNRRLLAYQDALRRYHPQPIDTLVRLFVAEQGDEGLPSTLGWERCVPAASLSLQTMPGDHHSMMQSPRIEVLARALVAALTAQSSDRSNQAMGLLL